MENLHISPYTDLVLVLLALILHFLSGLKNVAPFCIHGVIYKIFSLVLLLCYWKDFKNIFHCMLQEWFRKFSFLCSWKDLTSFLPCVILVLLEELIFSFLCGFLCSMKELEYFISLMSICFLRSWRELILFPHGILTLMDC